jgi:hypothetical protein
VSKHKHFILRYLGSCHPPLSQSRLRQGRNRLNRQVRLQDMQRLRLATKGKGKRAMTDLHTFSHGPARTLVPQGSLMYQLTWRAHRHPSQHVRHNRSRQSVQRHCCPVCTCVLLFCAFLSSSRKTQVRTAPLRALQIPAGDAFSLQHLLGSFPTQTAVWQKSGKSPLCSLHLELSNELSFMPFMFLVIARSVWSFL